MKKISIKIDREQCMGTGVCVLAAPEVFDQDDDGTAILYPNFDSEKFLKQIREAAASCPTKAISIEE